MPRESGLPYLTEQHYRALNFETIESGRFLLDPLSRKLLMSPKGPTSLTPTEVMLLHPLLVHPKHLLTYDLYSSLVLGRPTAHCEPEDQANFRTILNRLRTKSDIHYKGTIGYRHLISPKGLSAVYYEP